MPRFIPAPAGNIVQSHLYRPHLSVHPRTSGEHIPVHHDRFSISGSSPHQQGTSKSSVIFSTGIRFIPAPAGNISGWFPQPRRFPVHPRTSGEHSSVTSLAQVSAGSSPHQRGTWTRQLLRPLLQRFIPAPAGNIMNFFAIPCQSSVHPRTSGEHYVVPEDETEFDGSSPHQRGTLAMLIHPIRH